MRRLLVVVVLLMVGVSAYGVPREARERGQPGLRIVKRVVKALGDFIVVPTPGPKP